MFYLMWLFVINCGYKLIMSKWIPCQNLCLRVSKVLKSTQIRMLITIAVKAEWSEIVSDDKAVSLSLSSTDHLFFC